MRIIIQPGAVAGGEGARDEAAADHPALHLQHGGLQIIQVGRGHLEDVVRRRAEADTRPFAAQRSLSILYLYLLSLLCFVGYG